MNDDTSSSSCSSSSLSSLSDNDFLEELFDDKGEDDEEDLALFSILLVWISDMEERPIRPRNVFDVRERLEWEQHVIQNCSMRGHTHFQGCIDLTMILCAVVCHD
jgi:hypothetical protein